MRLMNGIHGLDYNDHGGGCCGIIHLSGFPVADAFREASLSQKVEWIRSAIKDAILSEYDDADEEYLDDWSCGVEVVLINQQLPYWQAALEEVGFKNVFSFLNSNSHNTCNVFYYQNGAQS